MHIDNKIIFYNGTHSSSIIAAFLIKAPMSP